MVGKKDTPNLTDRIRGVSGAAKPGLRPAMTPSGPPVVKSGRNKRRSERKSTFKQSVLILATGERLNVVLKNISDHGALIGFFSGGGTIAGRAQLIEPSTGLKKWARVIWRDQNSAGLEFEAN